MITTKPKKAPTKKAKAKAAPVTVKGYKGFDKDWKCRGFQFEIGKTYAHKGPVGLCKSGFHFCEAPLDCLNYYSIIDGHFAEVEASGVTDERGNDTKRAGSSIKIGARLSITARFPSSPIAPTPTPSRAPPSCRGSTATRSVRSRPQSSPCGRPIARASRRWARRRFRSRRTRC